MKKYETAWMVPEEKIQKFIRSQQSIQFYKKAQEAFYDVLSQMSENEFDWVTDNLIIMALHEWVLWQLMHFPEIKNGCRIIQLTIPHDIPWEVLRFVIAHEIWHIKQWRNRQEWDDSSWERNPDSYAESLWFPRTKEIDDYVFSYWKNPE